MDKSIKVGNGILIILFMKYLVKTSCLEWHTIGYIIDADSEEDAITLVEEGDGDICYDKYDSTDQINIEKIELYEN